MMVVMMIMMMMTEAVGREERFLLSVGRTRALAGRTLQAASNTLHVVQPRTTTKHQTLKHCHHQYLKSAKAININSNSKQRGAFPVKKISLRRSEREDKNLEERCKGSVCLQPEENDVLDDFVTLFNVLALAATTI